MTSLDAAVLIVGLLCATLVAALLIANRGTK